MATAGADEPGAWLETLTWPEAADRLSRKALVLIPIGAAAKEHGHHLPLGTDQLIAGALAEGVRQVLPVLVAPVISLGYYPAFRHYPGSQHLSPATFQAVITEVLDGLIAQGAVHLAILNTGVSTEPVVEVAVRETYERHGVRVPVAHIRRLGHGAESLFEQQLGGHGDEHETSLMLQIAPELVRMERAATDYGGALGAPRTVFYVPTVFSGDPAAGFDHSLTGVRGDPTLATADKGRAALDAMLSDLVDGLRALFPEQLGAPAP
jgi:creatinine amidohydrolase